MIGKRFVSIVAVSLFLLSVHVTGTMAGTEPSPFQPEINQLGAVANILQSADFRVVKAISVPPDPCTPPDPCKGLNGAVNRLNAISSQVGSADNMVRSMIEEVIGFEPTPSRTDIFLPLDVIAGVAQGIVDEVDAFEPPPDDSIPVEFMEALEIVAYSADALIDTVEESKEMLRSGLSDTCSDFNQSECAEVVGCVWIMPDGLPAYCTTE